MLNNLEFCNLKLPLAMSIDTNLESFTPPQIISNPLLEKCSTNLIEALENVPIRVNSIEILIHSFLSITREFP